MVIGSPMLAYDRRLLHIYTGYLQFVTTLSIMEKYEKERRKIRKFVNVDTVFPLPADAESAFPLSSRSRYFEVYSLKVRSELSLMSPQPLPSPSTATSQQVFLDQAMPTSSSAPQLDEQTYRQVMRPTDLPLPPILEDVSPYQINLNQFSLNYLDLNDRLELHQHLEHQFQLSELQTGASRGTVEGIEAKGKKNHSLIQMTAATAEIEAVLDEDLEAPKGIGVSGPLSSGGPFGPEGLISPGGPPGLKGPSGPGGLMQCCQ
ncbi:hypothetical protein BDZ89DRAFT_1048369 [Hymenopellis radicata]|nr:hypothetical protein BDZ89DRAFT_1048369 [Hymenopellis radicata]